MLDLQRKRYRNTPLLMWQEDYCLFKEHICQFKLHQMTQHHTMTLFSVSPICCLLLSFVNTHVYIYTHTTHSYTHTHTHSHITYTHLHTHTKHTHSHTTQSHTPGISLSHTHTHTHTPFLNSKSHLTQFLAIYKCLLQSEIWGTGNSQ